MLRETILSVILLAVTMQFASADDSSTGSEAHRQELIAHLKERQRRLGNYELIASVQETTGQDFVRHQELIDLRGAAQHKFYRTDNSEYVSYYSNRPKPTPGRKSPSYLGMVRMGDDNITLYRPSAPSLKESVNIRQLEHWDGIVWQQHIEQGSEHRVHLNDSNQNGRADIVFGINYYLEVLTKEISPKDVGDRQLNSIYVAKRTGETGQIEYVLTVVRPSSDEHKKKVINEETEIVFSEKYGFAPIIATSNEISRKSGEKRGKGRVTRWSNWDATMNGVHLPQQMSVDVFTTFQVPKDSEQGFRPLIINGEQVFDERSGAPVIDPTSIEAVRLDQVMRYEYRVHHYSSPPAEDHVTFPSAFPTGTFVQDNRGDVPIENRALYRLLAEGPAYGKGVGPVEQNPMDFMAPSPTTRFLPPRHPETNLYPWLLAGLATVLILGISVIGWKRRLG